MSDYKWDPQSYEKNFGFASSFEKPVIEMLEPKSGERILDLGCGSGLLAKELSEMGCSVLGVEVLVADAQGLTLDEKFDAVVTVASIHCIKDHYAVVRRVWNLLRPGGRFVGECGGEGCLRIVREGIKIALSKRGIDYKARYPWKFPELGDFTRILENLGFRVKFIARVDCPTQLDGSLRDWLEVEASPFTEGLTLEEKESFYAEVEEYCRPMLCGKDGKWTIDHVRLRFAAVKPEEE